MHIVFWSCLPGHAAVSSSMLSIACQCAAQQLMNTAILQTQYKKNNLQYPFFKITDKENVEEYHGVGMDSLLRVVKGGSVSGGVETCAVSFMGARLSVFTQSNNPDGKAYYSSLIQVFPLLMKSLDKTYDISFIDTAGGNDPASWRALETADRIVICLPQETWVINYLFSKYTFDPSKAFYLFTNYDKKLPVSMNGIIKSKQYKDKVTAKNTACIMHDADFATAMDNSTLVSFFTRGLDCKKSHPNYDYFASVKEATEKLLVFSGIQPRKQVE